MAAVISFKIYKNLQGFFLDYNKGAAMKLRLQTLQILTLRWPKYLTIFDTKKFMNVKFSP